MEEKKKGSEEAYPCQEAVEMIEAMDPQKYRSLLVALVVERKLGKSDLECLLASSDDLLPAAVRKPFQAVNVDGLSDRPLSEVVHAILSTTPTEPLGKWLIERFGSKKDMIVIDHVATLYLLGWISDRAKGVNARTLLKIKFFFFLLALQDTEKASMCFRPEKGSEQVSAALLESLPMQFPDETADQAEVFFENLLAHEESDLVLLEGISLPSNKRKSPPKEVEEVKEAKEVKIPEKKAEKPKKSRTLDDLVDFVVTSIDEASKKKFPCNCALVAMMGVHYMDIARLDKSEKETIQGMRNVLKTYAAREPTADVWFKAVLTDLDDAGSLSFLHKKTADKFTVNDLCEKMMENVLIKARVDHDFVVLLKDETPRKRQKKTKADAKEEPIEIDDDDESADLVLSPKEDAKKS